jgi:hypothetical protein
MGTDARHSVPSFVMGTPLVQAPGAKSPRISTEVSVPAGYVNTWSHRFRESSHVGAPLPPAPPAPVPEPVELPVPAPPALVDG